MTQCWPEGALRACLDGELPAEEMARVRAHLTECPVCDGLYSELAVRAARVAALMDTLLAWSGVAPVAIPRPARVPARRRNWVAALAMAAALALAFYLLPARRSPEARVVPALPPAPAPPPAAVVAHVAPPPPVVSPAPPAPRPARRVRATLPPQAAVAEVTPPAAVSARPARRMRATVPQPVDFVALDNEPFESGVVMRVDVKPGNLQADIVFGPDGRARAFRVVNASQRNF